MKMLVIRTFLQVLRFPFIWAVSCIIYYYICDSHSSFFKFQHPTSNAYRLPIVLSFIKWLRLRLSRYSYFIYQNWKCMKCRLLLPLVLFIYFRSMQFIINKILRKDFEWFWYDNNYFIQILQATSFQSEN